MSYFCDQDDLENFGDVGSLEDNVESFLSHDGGDGNIYGTLKQTLTGHKTESSKSNCCPVLHMLYFKYVFLMKLHSCKDLCFRFFL